MAQERSVESSGELQYDPFANLPREEEPPKIAATTRPPLVNLEGSDWLLTTLLLTLDAILLELYQSERTRWATFLTWFIEYECHSGWACELVDTLFIMAAAVVNVSLLIPVININIRTPSRKMWRVWLMVAWFSLLLVDAMTIAQLVSSIMMCVDRDDDVESWTAHFWLICVAVVVMAMLNVRFIYLYGWFTIFTCYEDETFRTTQGLAQIYYNETGKREKYIQQRQQLEEHRTSLLNVVKAPKLRRFNTGKFLEHVSTGFTKFVDRRDRFARTPGFQLGKRRAEEDSGDLSDLEMLLEKGWIHSCKGYITRKIKRAYTEVAEVESVFEYSSWIKAAAIFTILMLIYNCIKTAEVFFKLASSWDEYHSLARRFEHSVDSARSMIQSVGSNLTDMRQSATYDEGQFTAAVNDSLPTIVQDVRALQDTLEAVEATTGKAYDLAGSVLDLALLATAKLVDITDLKGNDAVGAFFYIDSIIPILQYTCIIGYPIGTMFGLYSLYQVLVQHKRMSLGLEQALAVRTNSMFGKEVLDEEDAKLTLLGIEKKYEIGGAVYFFGILMSTAVVQLHIFGFLITLCIAILVDVRNFDVLLNLGGYMIFVYCAVTVTNLALTHIIGDRLLTKEGFHIEHPWMFFIYLFTFSMVHAVLGPLYALWRAILLLVTTFWVLNRLDVSLFLTGKQFDNGHYSFMSMLLLTRVIRLTNIAQGYIKPPAGGGDPSDFMSDTDMSTGAPGLESVLKKEYQNMDLMMAAEEAERMQSQITPSSSVLLPHTEIEEEDEDDDEEKRANEPTTAAAAPGQSYSKTRTAGVRFS